MCSFIVRNLSCLIFSSSKGEGFFFEQPYVKLSVWCNAEDMKFMIRYTMQTLILTNILNNVMLE